MFKIDKETGNNTKTKIYGMIFNLMKKANLTDEQANNIDLIDETKYFFNGLFEVKNTIKDLDILKGATMDLINEMGEITKYSNETFKLLFDINDDTRFKKLHDKKYKIITHFKDKFPLNWVISNITDESKQYLYKYFKEIKKGCKK
jgi:hypothetical protein